MAALVAEGINSFKFFMVRGRVLLGESTVHALLLLWWLRATCSPSPSQAYKGALQVSDEELLAGMRRCSELGALVQVHAENGDAVADGQARVFAAGITGPEGHALSRPAVLEGEATGRAIRLAEFVGTPLYVVHVMSADAMEEIARAR